MTNSSPISGLSDLRDQYDAILCDVWGVLHNGRTVWPNAANALKNARDAGMSVVMITNAPRPQKPVLRQLDSMHCPSGVFDELVTSGDVTRSLIEELDGPVYHIGPERDYALYDGLNVEFAKPDQAAGIVCTGLFDDYNEHPDDYAERFQTYAKKGLPMICANPDIVVEVGDKLLWCAGALAMDYKKLGGETRIVGKPHKPIYQQAMSLTNSILDREVELSRILAIGDGLPTDVKGAADNGLDCLFITNGIHSAEYTDGNVDADKLSGFLEANGARPEWWIKSLVW